MPGDQLRRSSDEDHQQQVDLSSIFSLRKPKDVRAGLSSGLKSVAKGVIAGTVGLIAAPAIGAHQAGLKGFAKGAAAGLAGAVLLPATGVAVGATQAVRGLCNTPEAIRASIAGRHWDQEQRRWVDQPALALAAEGGASASARSQYYHQRQLPNVGPGSDDPDSDYYALLGVARDASPDQIRRAYYVAARRLHPDKNPGDTGARFQRLGEAYQVLGSPELRRRYDSGGRGAVDGTTFMDGAAFFTALFGSDRFEHLIGELMIAAAAKSGGDLSAAAIRSLQAAREQRLAVLLAALLRRYVEGDEAGFKVSMAAEAAELAVASFGEVMLHTIGAAYLSQAHVALGGLVEGTLASLRGRGRTLQSQFRAASLAIKVLSTQQQLARLDARLAEHAAARQAEAAAQQLHREQQQQQQEDVAAEPREEAQQQGSPDRGRSSSSEAADGGAAGPPPTPPPPLSSAAPKPGGGSPGGRPRVSVEALQLEKAALEETALPLMLDAMWAANVLDIEATLRHVCQAVLRDPAVSKAHRRMRALALRELGCIFEAAKAGADGDGEPLRPPGGGGRSRQAKAKAQLESAMQQVLEQRLQAEERGR